MPKMIRYAVRRSDGAVYPWTAELMKRGDMEEVFAETVQDALNKDSMPDPRRISLDQLEGMAKGDLILFAKIKMGLDLDASQTHPALLDEVKQAIFMRPSEPKLDAGTGPAKEQTTPMSSAAAARSRAGA